MKPVVIGVATAPNDMRKVSFHHLGEADMARELGATARAIHHYAGYPRWLGLN